MGESGAGRAGLTLAAWSRLHHGIDPAGVPMLRLWLRAVWALARPMRSVPPVVFTVAGALLAIDALLFAARSPWVAFGLVLAAVMCDALDGAVALLAGRASRFGATADKVADRIADSAFALVIWRCGAPLWLALVAGSLSLVHEAVRTVRGRAALAQITVAERPSRAVCTLLACVCAGVSATTWPATVCAAVWIGLALIGLAQVAAA
ncbi:MAG: CDP-alcohol phosphatidyltransferase family protein [Jatrophihabitantaceae bacterium]